MIDLPRIITGLCFLLLGFFLIFSSVLSSISYWVLFFGIIILIIGIVILLNKKENKIEEVRKK